MTSAGMESQEQVLFDRHEYRAKLSEHLSELSRQVNFVDYPINPKIGYEYPDLDEMTLVNIANALVVFPKFYTQVLHLMNKMNLPCPLVGQVRKYEKASVLSELKKANKLHLIRLNLANLNESIAQKEETRKKPTSGQIVEEEDEEEEANEEPVAASQEQNKADFTKDLERKKFSVKSLTKPAPEKSAVTKSTYDINDIFENGSKNVLAKRRINITDALKTTTLPKTTTSPEPPQSKSPPVSPEPTTETAAFITDEELAAKRLKMAELRELPVFKNYAAGERSNKIYIKNVGKRVEEPELRRVFGRYVNWTDEREKAAFEIRLMKEGRMKGQAFVSFAGEEAAQRAIDETNGLVLDGKPIIVQYGRSTSAAAKP